MLLWSTSWRNPEGGGYLTSLSASSSQATRSRASHSSCEPGQGSRLEVQGGPGRAASGIGGHQDLYVFSSAVSWVWSGKGDLKILFILKTHLLFSAGLRVASLHWRRRHPEHRRGGWWRSGGDGDADRGRRRPPPPNPTSPHPPPAAAHTTRRCWARRPWPRPGEQGLTKGQDRGGHFLWIPGLCRRGLGAARGENENGKTPALSGKACCALGCGCGGTCGSPQVSPTSCH